MNSIYKELDKIDDNKSLQENLFDLPTIDHVTYVIKNVTEWKRSYSPKNIKDEVAVSKACEKYDDSYSWQEYLQVIQDNNLLELPNRNKLSSIEQGIKRELKSARPGNILSYSPFILRINDINNDIIDITLEYDFYDEDQEMNINWNQDFEGSISKLYKWLSDDMDLTDESICGLFNLGDAYLNEEINKNSNLIESKILDKTQEEIEALFNKAPAITSLDYDFEISTSGLLIHFKDGNIIAAVTRLKNAGYSVYNVNREFDGIIRIEK